MMENISKPMSEVISANKSSVIINKNNKNNNKSPSKNKPSSKKSKSVSKIYLRS